MLKIIPILLLLVFLSGCILACGEDAIRLKKVYKIMQQEKEKEQNQKQEKEDFQCLIS